MVNSTCYLRTLKTIIQIHQSLCNTTFLRFISADAVRLRNSTHQSDPKWLIIIGKQYFSIGRLVYLILSLISMSLEHYLPVFSFQLSISAKDTTSIVQLIPRTLWYRSTNNGDLQTLSDFRKHGCRRRCITTRVDILSKHREAIIWIRTVPYFLRYKK